MAGAHDYQRYTNHPDDPFTARVMAIKNDDASGLEDSPENAPAEKVKEWAEAFQREDKAAQARIANQQTGDAFIAGHPEIVDSVPNAKLFVHEMDRMFGEGLHPLEHFEAAYESLRASDFLTLNKAELAKQQKAAAKQRFDAERARSVEPSMDQMYSMSMDDLRRLDAVENQKRAQRIAEEGGF